MQLTKITLALTAVFAVTAVNAADDPTGKTQVGEATKKVVEALETGDMSGLVPEKGTDSTSLTGNNLPKAAPSSAKSADNAQYPKVPARYLRPEAKPAEQKAATANLKKAVEATTPKAEERPQYNKVSINTGKVIALKPGDNVFIPISSEHPNRLLTPFTNPQVISTTLSAGKRKDECGEVCVRDGVIYITTDNPSAVTAFITEKGHEDIAFSVTMVPQAIPPREVRFTLPADVTEQLRRDKGRTGGMKRAQIWETSQPYVETLKQSMRAVALGQVPDGYTLRNVRPTDRVPTCRHPGLNIDFTRGQVMEGYNLNIYAGVITNTADTPVEFRNQNCGSWKNAAVTSWPLTLLRPGQQTEIYIAVKHEDEVAPETVRKPLINREFN